MSKEADFAARAEDCRAIAANQPTLQDKIRWTRLAHLFDALARDAKNEPK